MGRKLTINGFVKQMKYNGQIQRNIEECHGEFHDTDFPSKSCKHYRVTWSKKGYVLEDQ